MIAQVILPLSSAGLGHRSSAARPVYIKNWRRSWPLPPLVIFPLSSRRYRLLLPPDHQRVEGVFGPALRGENDLNGVAVLEFVYFRANGA